LDSQHEETLNAVKNAASEHVPFKIEAYLDEFSKALAKEVSTLLAEVGKLREERRNIQYEIGCLLCKNSKYGPDGEFDPSWYVCSDLSVRKLTDPRTPASGPCAHGPPMPGAAPNVVPVTEVPSAPLPPADVPPAWRNLPTSRPRKSAGRSTRRATQAPVLPPAALSPQAPAMPMAPTHYGAFMMPPTVHHRATQPASAGESWATWQRESHSKTFWTRCLSQFFSANRDLEPSPPSTSPLLEVPDVRPPGLFGPRSPARSHRHGA